MKIEWEPETEILLETAGIEATADKVNIAVRQWLRQILRHREYLAKVKADPERHTAFRNKRNAYGRRYRKFGPKRVQRASNNFDAGTQKFHSKPEEDMCERSMKLVKVPPKKRSSITVLGSM